jgi:hypothetical protein
MFGSVDKVLADLKDLVERLDPESLDPSYSLELYEKCCLGERLFSAAKALASRRLADSGAWHETGQRSPAHFMAATARSTVGHAVRVLQTAEMLQKLPETEAAYRRGAMSEVQAIEVVSAASADPSFQEELLDAAECDALEELRRQCARVRAGAIPESERHQRAHRNRQLRHWTDIEGAFRLDGRFTPEARAVVMAARS